LKRNAREPIDYVDPFIGTTNFSVCNPGAICPNGMMSVVPFNVMGPDLNVYDKDKRWWSAPYEYKNKYFTGFAHVTLSGVGCPELGTLPADAHKRQTGCELSELRFHIPQRKRLRPDIILQSWTNTASGAR
jgi:putative alpha-1,2-mannosidase